MSILYLCHDTEILALVTSHLGSGFEHFMRGLWEVRESLRSRRINIERWDVTATGGWCFGLSAGQGSSSRESKIGENLHSHERAGWSQSSRDHIRTSLILTVPITVLIVMQEGTKTFFKRHRALNSSSLEKDGPVYGFYIHQLLNSYMVTKTTLVLPTHIFLVLSTVLATQ